MTISPNTSPVFEALPAELLANILHQMASPEDVYSTIRASPNAFGSFRCFRESILIEVLQAHLPAEIFAEFLGLLYIPKYEDLNYVPNRREFEVSRTGPYNLRYGVCPWEDCRWGKWTTVLDAFLETHFGNVRAAESSGVQTYSVPQAHEKHQINYIISMYGTLKRFMRDYQSFVRSIPTGNPPPLSDLDPSFRRQEAHLPQYWPPLSETERLRLQRGFLRYELVSRLNAIPTWNTQTIQRGELPPDCFQRGVAYLCGFLQRWEDEEIRCVWTYVYRQYQVLVQAVVSEFRCDVRRLSRKARHAPDNEVIRAPDISHGICWNPLRSWIYNMSCLGLPMLQQLLRSHFDDQRRFLKSTLSGLLPKLEGALLLFDESELAGEWDETRRSWNRSMTHGASPIYTPVTADLAQWPTDDYRDEKRLRRAEVALREIGWVFWENPGRLEYLGWSGLDTGAGNSIEKYLKDLAYRNKPERFEAEDKYPERSMYVTKEDYQGELAAKYAVGPLRPGGERFFGDRLRKVSDWPSKEASPALLEIFRGPPTSG